MSMRSFIKTVFRPYGLRSLFVYLIIVYIVWVSLTSIPYEIKANELTDYGVSKGDVGPSTPFEHMREFNYLAGDTMKGQKIVIQFTNILAPVNLTIWGLKIASENKIVYSDNDYVKLNVNTRVETMITVTIIASQEFARITFTAFCLEEKFDTITIESKIYLPTLYYYVTGAYLIGFSFIILGLTLLDPAPIPIPKKTKNNDGNLMQGIPKGKRSKVLHAFIYELQSFNYLIFTFLYLLFRLSFDLPTPQALYNSYSYGTSTEKPPGGYSSPYFKYMAIKLNLNWFMIMGFLAIALLYTKIRSESEQVDIHERSMMLPQFTVVLGKTLALTTVLSVIVIFQNYYIDFLLIEIFHSSIWVIDRGLITLVYVSAFFLFSASYYSLEMWLPAKLKFFLLIGITLILFDGFILFSVYKSVMYHFIIFFQTADSRIEVLRVLVTWIVIGLFLLYASVQVRMKQNSVL